MSDKTRPKGYCHLMLNSVVGAGIAEAGVMADGPWAHWAEKAVTIPKQLSPAMSASKTPVALALTLPFCNVRYLNVNFFTAFP